MPIVSLEDVGMSYGADDVLSDVSVEISAGDRIGVIGPNGTGKSTLLRIIAGIETPTRGRLERARNLRIAYLPQESQLGTGNTVYQEALQAFTPIRDMEAELHLLEGQMDDTRQVNQTLDRYHRVLERYEKLGGYTYQSETRSVLSALGFGNEDWDRQVSTLSGGEKARAALARVILESPDLMLLDEPTNHLDFAALDWVEAYLSKWPGTLIISTHDRQLLSTLPNRIWAVQDGKVRTYRGAYKEYLKVHQQEQETLLKRYREQQSYVERTEEFIRRHHAGQKHAQAKDREKKLERLERVEPPRTVRRISFTLDAGSRGPDLVLQARDLVVGFKGGSSPTGAVLFRCPELRLYRGDKVALIGPNGSGKTTFLRALLGEMPPLGGFLDFGMGVQKGFLPQERGAYLDKNMTLVEAMMAGTGLERAEARSMLGRFLFSGDDAFKRLGNLSGGELSRVALARVSHLRGNLLLLDEPTNHLDIESREVLQAALAGYEGTLIMVSHDRYLIDAIATTIWEIRDGVLHVFKGSYSFYRQRQQEEMQAREQARTRANNTATHPAQRRPTIMRQSASEDHQAQQESILVQEITALEGEIAKLEMDLVEASYGQDHQRIAELHAQHKLKSRLLQEKMDLWASLERLT